MYITIHGRVTEGRKLGRTIGFPTANVALDSQDQALESLSSGVYLSRIKIGSTWHASVTNIGTNPSVGGNERRSESYIFDFKRDLYGESITIELRDKLRDELHFESIELLREQILKDVTAARSRHREIRG